ncbi:MAG: flagellar M-ring protein FliF [Cognaticolwellia sp.]|jgi:flagellar M-ring protein FliF
MPFDIQPLIDQLKTFWESLEANRRVALVATVLVSVVLVISTGIWASQASTYTIMKGSSQDIEGGAGALSKDGIWYDIEDNGSRLVVYETDVGAARVAIAADGLQAGLEIIEKLPVGSTARQLDIAEKAQLERDLSMTLTQLRPVKSASVHLVLPEDNSFLVSEKREATASVVMALSSGSGLSEQQLKGVVNLVAAAVPELTPKGVNVINQNGELLWDGKGVGGMDGAEGDEMTRKRRILEQDLEQKIARNLRSVLPDPASFSVSVRAELSHTASVGERMQLLEGVALEERIEESKSFDGAGGVGGAAGAEANTGTPEGGAGGGGNEKSKILTTTTPGHDLLKSTTDRGQLERISVAVTVDSAKVEEIAIALAGEGAEPDLEEVRKQLHTLAMNSAGAAGEQDSVEVIVLPFGVVTVEMTTGALVGASALPYLPYAIAVLALALVFGMVVRPVMKLVMTQPKAEPTPEEVAAAEAEAEGGDDLAARLREMVDNYESVDREDLNLLAQREAEAAAQVIRLWSRGA